MTTPGALDTEGAIALNDCWVKLAVADREIALYLFLSKGLEQVMKTNLDDRLLTLDRLWCEYKAKVGNGSKTP